MNNVKYIIFSHSSRKKNLYQDEDELYQSTFFLYNHMLYVNLSKSFDNSGLSFRNRFENNQVFDLLFYYIRIDQKSRGNFIQQQAQCIIQHLPYLERDCVKIRTIYNLALSHEIQQCYDMNILISQQKSIAFLTKF